jgi:hypothetical protein
MVSKKHHRHKSSSSSSSSRSKNCKGGRKSSKRARTEKKRKTHKWHQKGCQSGGSSLVGGSSAWQASNIQHQGGSGSGAATAGLPNGNHYALNTAISAPAQSSNHLVEKGMFGGRRSKGSKRGRKHRRFIGEQHGGMAQYLPEIANAEIRGIAEVPSGMVNSLQGASTAFKTSNPTVQPIGEPLRL